MCYITEYYYLFPIFIISSICADWVQIPPLKPKFSISPTSKISVSDIKTPLNVIFHTEQVESIESFNDTLSTQPINAKISTKNFSSLNSNKNVISTKPSKTKIMEIFTSTTQFTPLMSSEGVTMTPTTMPTPTEPTILTERVASISKQNTSRNKKKSTHFNQQNTTSDGIEIEDDLSTKDGLEGKEIPDVGSFSSYAGFLPFLRSIQDTLLQKAHKSIKSKIQVLTDLRDNLLYEIDQRIQKLWYGKEQTSEARGYKRDHHMDFPSNEAALMTLGFLTLAVFLVKLVLKVISAIKAKKAYYTTTTTTMATMTGRKRRQAEEFPGLDIDTTYKILSSIENLSLKYGP